MQHSTSRCFTSAFFLVVFIHHPFSKLLSSSSSVPQVTYHFFWCSVITYRHVVVLELFRVKRLLHNNVDWGVDGCEGLRDGILHHLIIYLQENNSIEKIVMLSLEMNTKTMIGRRWWNY